MKTLASLALLTLVHLAGPAFAQVTTLTRATLIDGTGAPARENVTIVMQDGRIKEIGPAAKGKVADLLVLTRNPLDNIRNMQTIETVYLGGKKFE